MQPPQPNVLQFKPAVSSMNNIVISPDQDSAAFVLGSQQAVGSSENMRPYVDSGNDKNSFVHPVKFSNKDQYDIEQFGQMGYSTMKPQGFAHASTTETSTTMAGSKIKLGPGGLAGSVRFPADNYENAPIVTGTFKADQKPVIADSLALPQQGIQNQVMFPSIPQLPLGPNQVRENNVFSSYQVGNNQQQPHQPHQHASGDKFNLVSFESDRFNGQPQQHQQNPQLGSQQGPLQQNPLQQNPLQQGPLQQGPLQQGPPQQGPPQHGPHQQGPLHQGPLQHGPTPQQNIIGGNSGQPVRLPDITNDLNPPHQEPVKHSQFRPDQNRHDLVYNGFPRPGPQNQHQRPTNDRTLPNILPQFRPNSQMFHGHKESGPFRMGPHSRPPFVQTPNGMRYRPPIHFRHNYPTKSGLTTTDPNIGNQIDNNRRYFQVRPAQHAQPEKIFDRAVPPPQPYQRQASDRYPTVAQPNIGTEPDLTERKFTVVNELERNTPRRSIAANEYSSQDEKVLRIEPVVTLQMIQQQKLQNKHALSSAPQPPKESVDEHPLGLAPNKNTPPVYVVYPMQKNSATPNHENVVSVEDRETIVVGKRGAQNPFPPPEVTAGSEYQNTPFTVIRQEQKPILGAKPKASPYQKQVFPYSLERIKENYQNGLYNLGEEPTDAIPRVVNKGSSLYADVYNDEKIVNK